VNTKKFKDLVVKSLAGLVVVLLRVNQNSQSNVFVNNNVTSNSEYGFYFYDNAQENQVKNNYIAFNGKGAYLKSGGNEFVENAIKENQYGVYLYSGSKSSRFHNNIISANKYYEVYYKRFSALQTAKF